MGTYELICLILTLLIIVVTLANIIVLLLRKRKRTTVATETSETPVEQPVVQPVQEVVVKEYVEDVVADEVVIEDIVEEQAVQESEDIDLVSALRNGTLEETDSGATVQNADGTVIYVGYNKSFKAKLSQATDEVRDYYNTLKNHVLSYNGVKTSISWGQESVRYGKVKVCIFVLRDNTLQVYLPLNPDNYYLDTIYKVERTEEKFYNKPSCLYKIINKGRVKCATELIDKVMKRFHTERKDKVAMDYAANYPYEDNLSLITRKLIKVTMSTHPISADK